MAYEVILKPPASRDLDKLPDHELEKISKRLLQLGYDPRPIGVQKLTAEEGYRIRVGDYRVLFIIDDVQRKVFIYRIKHRKDVYR